MELKRSKKTWGQIFDESVSGVDYYQRHGAPPFVNKYYDHQLRRAFRMVINNLEVEGKAVLEVGAGTGRWAQEFSKMNCAYYGIDFNPKAILVARNENLPNCRFLVMDATRLAFRTQNFDLAISITAIMHIPTEGWRLAVKELVRVVKPNGRIALIENRRYPWIEEFSKNGCELLMKRGQRYSFLRELPEGRLPLPLKLNQLLTSLSYPLEPLFERIVPIRFAKHAILVFRKQ